MQKKETTPLWVFLAFSSINTRKGAIILIWSCVLFTIYSVPWSLFFSESAWVSKIFLIDDWGWLPMMLPIVIWYWLGLRWADKHSAWDD